MNNILLRIVCVLAFLISIFFALLSGFNDCGYSCDVPMSFFRYPLYAIGGLVTVCFLIILFKILPNHRTTVNKFFYGGILVQVILVIGLLSVNDDLFLRVERYFGNSGAICILSSDENSCRIYLAMARQDTAICKGIKDVPPWIRISSDMYKEATIDAYSWCANEAVSYGYIYTDKELSQHQCDTIDRTYVDLVQRCEKLLEESNARKY
jgi:hypothetical protein